jgi:copper chaperone CopZ
MKKAIIEGMCCEGCAKDVKFILSNIYGISDINVSLSGGYATFEGFVSKEVISSCLSQEGYRLIDIQKM